MSDGPATPHSAASAESKPIWQRQLERACADLPPAACAYLADRVGSMAERDLEPHLRNRSTQQIRAWLDEMLAERPSARSESPV